MIVAMSKSAMKLYFSRNYNPRLAVAAARFLNSPVEFEFASPFSPEQRERFLKLNPNQSVPIWSRATRRCGKRTPSHAGSRNSQIQTFGRSATTCPR
jgi:hypothetical protein